MSQKPSLFIGSSSESVRLAQTVQELLQDSARTTVWNHGVFEPGSFTLESLEQQLDTMDFAVLVLSPDDITISRGEQSLGPRDNVLFELGLFTGRLGRQRAYYMFDRTHPVRLPTDLAGVAGLAYEPTKSDWLSALGPACNQLRRQIERVGAREKLDRPALEAYARHSRFRERLAGTWWEYVMSTEGPSLSFVTIEPDADTSAVKLRGDTYLPDGNHFGVWESIGAILHVSERRICYTWRGWFPASPDKPYEGFGEVLFSGTNGRVDRGSGTYFNISVVNLDTTKRAVRMERCAPGEIAEMESGDPTRIAAVVRRKLVAA